MNLTYTNNDVSEVNKSINEIISNHFHLSARLLTKLIKNKKIYKNNKIVDTRDIINFGDTIKIDLNIAEDNSNIIPKKLNLNIIYEDEWLLIIDKPSGIPVHPSLSHYKDSLSNGVRYYFDQIGLKKKIRPVNRLDLNTSGLVIFAKCEYIQEELIKQMQNNTFEKTYICIVEGYFKNKSGTINLPIARKENSIIERTVSDEGQESITHYEILKEFNKDNLELSLVKCILETGRTHQIRVHMSHIGHPILDDTLYGNSSNLINRQALHSYKVSFIHPIRNKLVSFISNIPKEFKTE